MPCRPDQAPMSAAVAGPKAAQVAGDHVGQGGPGDLGRAEVLLDRLVGSGPGRATGRAAASAPARSGCARRSPARAGRPSGTRRRAPGRDRGRSAAARRQSSRPRAATAAMSTVSSERNTFCPLQFPVQRPAGSPGAAERVVGGEQVDRRPHGRHPDQPGGCRSARRRRVVVWPRSRLHSPTCGGSGLCACRPTRCETAGSAGMLGADQQQLPGEQRAVQAPPGSSSGPGRPWRRAHHPARTAVGTRAARPWIAAVKHSIGGVTSPAPT